MTESDSPTNKSYTAGQRSRGGCVPCRARRKKCDERRPMCLACQARHLDCTYQRAPGSRPPRGKRSASAHQLKPLILKAYTGLPTPPLLSSQPSAPSEGLLVHHFRTKLADLICFPYSDTGNPFLSHILPLIHTSKLVHTAVEAVAAGHLYMLRTKSLVDTQILQSKTLKLLASNLSSTNLNFAAREQALAGSLLLIYYEVVVGNCAKTARYHLKGAKSLLDIDCDVLISPSFRFLCKIYQYFDVVVSLSLGLLPLGSPHFIFEDYARVDETFGLVGTLWPLMESFAEILARKNLGEDVEEEARDLEFRLHGWSVGCPAEMGIERDTNSEAMVQLARAYRYSCLLELYSGVIIPSWDGSQNGSPNGTVLRDHIYTLQHVYQQALDSVIRVCALSGPMSTLTWPLHTVATKAQSIEDKTMMRHVFSRFAQRQHMKVVDAARDSVVRHWLSDPSVSEDEVGAVLFG